MISIPFQLQAPFLVVLLGIFVCLIFETAGVPEGFRRYGSKKYLTLISVIIISYVFFLLQGSYTSSLPEAGFVFDSLAKAAMMSISTLALLTLLLIVSRDKEADGARGETYSLLLFAYFFGLIVCAANDLLLLSVVVCARPLLQIGLLAGGNAKTLAFEASLKLVLYAAFTLLLLSFVFIFLDFPTVTPSFLINQNLGSATIIFLLLLLLLGIPPLQTFRIDFIDGAPAFISAFASASTLIVSGVILARLLSSLDPFDPMLESTYFLLIIFAGISLCVSAIFALDQTKIARLSNYLIASQAGLILLAFAFNLKQTINPPDYFYGLLFTHFALCSVGVYAAIDHWKSSKRAFNTWEDFSGVGRENPLVAAAFLVVLSSICGLPFTSGFVLRYTIIELTPDEFRFPVISIIFLSIVLSAVSVLRLMGFLFGKAQRHEVEKSRLPMNIWILCFCALALVLASLTPKTFLIHIFG